MQVTIAHASFVLAALDFEERARYITASSYHINGRRLGVSISRARFASR
jgi:hypothetical protein